ncbi:hypothetical protein [Francisella sp. LA112445]|uniref:hypothetical protein n=1 Tax=Francisella sp. LA112445 TaxID=1395624 RepID=UPI001788DA18|nr:hypothetical protein [Francisella sp. LA112445]QIW09665.1 hypothetical protein FIP56_02825 [Francisella sp. LA112445]
MKIALIDNMNNNFFAFARYLRDSGLNAVVYEIPNSSMNHFSSQSDTFYDVKKINWIKKFPVDINNKNWLFFEKEKIIDEFADYDLIISCGLSSAYLERAGLKSDIIIPYGSDLYMIPFKKIKFSLSLSFIRSLFLFSQARYQIKAYENSRVLITDNGYELYRNALIDLNLRALNLGIPMLYSKEDLDSDENMKIWSFLDKYDFIVFNHSRQYWCSNIDELDDFSKYGGAKRNDKLIKAFARFIKITAFSNPILVLFEYGPDVESSKKLVNKLDISKYVVWMPVMDRKNTMYGLSKATFSSNAFRESKTDIGGVCYESLAAGTLNLNNCIEAIENPEHKFFNSPMIHALSDNDILKIFLDYESSPQKYKKMSQVSKEWFEENLGVGLAKKYVKLIKLLVKNRKLTQNDIEVRSLFEK